MKSAVKIREYSIDPDFRREAFDPNKKYCVNCQREVNIKTAVPVTVDWDNLVVREGGKDFMGSDCWKKVTGGKP